MLGLTRGYYGISLATRNLSAISDHPGKTDFQPSPPNQFKLLTPTCNRCPVNQTYPSCQAGCLDVSIELLSQHMEHIAAVIVEPVISAGGMIFPPKDYMQKLYAAVHRAGALFIADEAQTGFGRCGKWFDIESYEIQPDILVLSKTAGNGYPTAAVVVSEPVAQALERQHFTHLSSHQNDPLAAAAIESVIDVVEEQGLVEHSRVMGEYFRTELMRLKNKHPLIKDVRGRGLMLGMELIENRSEEGVAFLMTLLCEQRGLHLTFSYFEPVMRFIPPLIITRPDVDLAISIMEEVLTIIENGEMKLQDVLPKNGRSGPFIRGMVCRPSPATLLRKLWKTSPQELLNKLAAR
jgi:4-aminobutyrate aminotransferase-like enzyme